MSWNVRRSNPSTAVNSTSYTMGTGVLPGGKAAGA